MKNATTIVQMLIRLVGVIILVLGVLFWTGNARSLIPVHMLLGFVLVILLWVQAGLAARARVGAGLIALVVVWGLVMLVFGMVQAQLLPGGAHWVIQVLHLLIGVGAIGQAEALAARIKRAQAQARPADAAPASIGSR